MTAAAGERASARRLLPLPSPSAAAVGRVPATGLWLALVFLVGLGLRLVWVLPVQQSTPFLGDTYWYLNVAANVLEGKGFAANHYNILLEPPDRPQETAYSPPAYPVALAALWKVVGVSATSARLFNAVLGAFTIFFVYGIGRQIFDRRVGLTAAGLFALFPNAIAWLPILLSETLFTFLFAAALWALLAPRPRDSILSLASPLGFGLLAGLAALTRGEGLVLLPAALLFWPLRDGVRAGLRQVGLGLLATAVVLTPWTVRNWVVLGSPVVVASNTGVNMRIGHAPEATGTFVWFADPIEGIELWRSSDRPDWEVRSYRVYTQRAMEYALTHPWNEVVLAKNKVYHLYKSDGDMVPNLATYGPLPVRPSALRWVTDASWYALAFATVLSASFWLRRDPYRLLPVAVVILWTLFHVVFFGLARYHLPLLPLLVIAATGGVWLALGTLRTWSARVVGTPAGRRRVPTAATDGRPSSGSG